MFGLPPTESLATLPTSESTGPSAKTPTTQPPKTLNYLGAASPQVSDITRTTAADILTTITQMFTSMQATQLSLAQKVESLTIQSTQPSEFQNLQQQVASLNMQMQQFLHASSTQPLSSKRDTPSDDFSSNTDSKRPDHKETPGRLNNHEG